MDTSLAALPWWTLVMAALCLVGVIMSIGIAGFTFFLKAGVAINEARKAPHMDSGNYRIDQGREIRSEDDGSAR